MGHRYHLKGLTSVIRFPQAISRYIKSTKSPLIILNSNVTFILMPIIRKTSVLLRTPIANVSKLKFKEFKTTKKGSFSFYSILLGTFLVVT